MNNNVTLSPSVKHTFGLMQQTTSSKIQKLEIYQPNDVTEDFKHLDEEDWRKNIFDQLYKYSFQ